MPRNQERREAYCEAKSTSLIFCIDNIVYSKKKKKRSLPFWAYVLAGFEKEVSDLLGCFCKITTVLYLPFETWIPLGIRILDFLR